MSEWEKLNKKKDFIMKFVAEFVLHNECDGYASYGKKSAINIVKRKKGMERCMRRWES